MENNRSANSRVLYNFYGEKSAIKIPEVANIFSNKLKQVSNEYERNLERAKIQKKIDKDLFIVTRAKLKLEKKRNLKGNAKETRNKKRVLVKSFKEITKISSKVGLLKYEIKKIDAKIEENSQYVDSLYKWTKNSLEATNVKVTKFKTSLKEASENENNLFLIKNALIYLWNKESKSLDDSLMKFYKENKSYVATIEKALIERIKTFNADKEKQLSKIRDDLAEIKIQSSAHRTRIENNYKKELACQEEKYNKEFAEKVNSYQERKNSQLKTLKLVKNQYFDTDNSIKSAEKSLKKSSKTKIALIKHINKILIKEMYIKEIYEIAIASFESAGINFKNQVIDEKISRLTNNVDQYQQIFKNVKDVKSIPQNLKKLLVKISKQYKTIKKIISNFSKAEVKKIKNEPIKKTKIAHHFGKIGKAEIRYYTYLKCKSILKLRVAKELEKISYDGDLLTKNSQAKIEFVDDWQQELFVLNKDRINSKIKQIEIHHSNLKQKEFAKFKKTRLDIQKKWNKEIIDIKKRYKGKTITKTALKQKIKEYKIFRKEEIREAKLNNAYQKAQGISSSFKFRYFGKRRICKKVYYSKISENRKATPIETFKCTRFVAALLNFILPGLAPLTIFKQYKKGILLVALSLALYAIFIPFIIGISSSRFAGIVGIIDMGKSTRNWSAGIIPDARFYLLGGIISIFMLIALVVYQSMSSISAHRTGKMMEHGVRPLGWANTRKWLSREGFPLLISFPGWIMILLIVVTPILTSLLISFTNMGFNHEPPNKDVDWVGLEQYGKWYVFKDVGMAKSIGRVLLWTVIWTLLSSSLVIGLGTLMAVLVNQNKIKFKKFWRMMYIIPWAIPAFVTIMFLKSAFQPGADALINMVLMKLGMISDPINWMASIWTVRIILIIIQGWLGHSYIFLLITGNMQSISKDIYEASEIDGANNNQKFRYLTMPILLQSVAPLLIAQFTFNFNNFMIISLFSGGGPAYSDPTPFLEGGTDIMISWIYKLTTSIAQIDGNLAFAAAMTILSSVITVGIAAYGFVKSSAFRRY